MRLKSLGARHRHVGGLLLKRCYCVVDLKRSSIQHLEHVISNWGSNLGFAGLRSLEKIKHNPFQKAFEGRGIKGIKTYQAITRKTKKTRRLENGIKTNPPPEGLVESSRYKKHQKTNPRRPQQAAQQPEAPAGNNCKVWD